MKKAFALALAVLMVCTMAFAVSTGNQTGYPGGTSAADNTYMQSIVPGQSIVFTQEELGLTDQNWGKTNGSFDPKKNTVALTVPVGSDLRSGAECELCEGCKRRDQLYLCYQL